MTDESFAAFPEQRKTDAAGGRPGKERGIGEIELHDLTLGGINDRNVRRVSVANKGVDEAENGGQHTGTPSNTHSRNSA